MAYVPDYTIQRTAVEILSARHPSSASLAGSEVPSSPAASPRGKPRTQKILANIIHRSALLRELRVAKLATPTGTVETKGYSNQRSALPQLRSRRLRRNGNQLNRLYHFSRHISPGFVKKAESHKKYQDCQFQFVKIAAIIKTYTGGTPPEVQNLISGGTM